MSSSDNSNSDALNTLAATPCRPGAPALKDGELAACLASLTGWERRGVAIEKTFRFAQYMETIGFVSAVGWIAQRQDHHPDMVVGYNRCTVAWTTHDAGGVTLNDCIAAARTEALLT